MIQRRKKCMTYMEEMELKVVLKAEWVEVQVDRVMVDMMVSNFFRANDNYVD